MIVAASFTGCIDSENSEDTLAEPVGEVNVPGNALVFTRDADATECSNGGITLDVGVDDDGDGTLNATEIFNTSTICNGADGVAGEKGEPGEKGEMGDQGDPGEDGSSCSAFDNGNGTYTVSCSDGTSFTVSDGQDVTRSNDTLLTRIDDPDDSLNCVAGGRVISYGLDNGDGDGISANGNLEFGEIDTSNTLCSTMSFGLFRDINLGSGSSSPTYFTALDDERVIFSADNGESGMELWVLSPETGSVVRVKDINIGSDGSNPNGFTEMNGELYFEANDGEHGTELWKTDGTEEGTTMVKDLNNNSGGSSSPYRFIEFNSELYFIAYDGDTGWKLWKTNGTEEGTVIVREDIYSGGEFSVIGDYLYFDGSESTYGTELWKTDGTEEGTTMVKDIRDGSGGSNPFDLTEFNGDLYFSANDGTTGYELWKTDGTSIGTILVADINEDDSSYGSYPASKTEFNGELYFRANNGDNGYELWKTDGTGAELVKDIYSGSGHGSPYNFKVMNGELYFSADDGEHGNEIWKTNGTTSGTSMVIDLNPGSASSTYFTQSVVHTDVYGVERLYYAADAGSFGSELYFTDGTAAGTVLVKDFSYGSSSGVVADDCGSSGYCGSLTMLSFGKYLLFSATDGYFGIELYYNNVVETSVFYS